MAATSCSALAYSLHEDDATGCVTNVVPVAIDIEARALVALDKGYEFIAQTCSTKKPETENRKLDVRIVNWSISSRLKAIVVSTPLAAQTQTHKADLQKSVRKRCTLMGLWESPGVVQSEGDVSLDRLSMVFNESLACAMPYLRLMEQTQNQNKGTTSG